LQLDWEKMLGRHKMNLVGSDPVNHVWPRGGSMSHQTFMSDPANITLGMSRNAHIRQI